MNKAYCVKCGPIGSKYDMNHRCMNCGEIVWFESAEKMKEKVKTEPLPEVLAKMRKP